MEYEIAPLYDLIDQRKYRTQHYHLSHFLKALVREGNTCKQKQCSNKGTCVVNQEYYEKPYSAIAYSRIFKPKQCVCNEDWAGERCEKPFNVLDIKKNAEKDAKKLAWTTFNVNDRYLYKNTFTGYKGESNLYLDYLNRDKNFLVFGQSYSSLDARNSNKSYGSKIIAVNKKEALDSKIIMQAKSFKTTYNLFMRVLTPVCDSGYSPVSDYLVKN